MVKSGAFTPEEIGRRITQTVEVLEKRFGLPIWERRDPLDELMVTMLSQNTNDKNRDLAYRRLRESFDNWRDVMQADVEQIEHAIRPAGLSRQKSTRMKAVLHWVYNTFGGFTLEPLTEMSDDEAIALLTARKGIGIKTAAVVLAFAFDRDICPVDTHVHRIALRLGWVPEKSTAEATFHAIKQHISTGKSQTFHLNLLKFGRTVCTARKPDCVGCPLKNDCVWVKMNPISGS